MRQSEITRRAFVGAVAAARLSAAGDGWVPLFNGRDLEGWRASEHQDTWKVVDGQLAAGGARSHLFYTGPVRGADFRNFELEVEAMAGPRANSGVYFHTAYQETGFPQKGFEVQINNTALGEGTYRERKKTGSLYGVRNVYKQLVGGRRVVQAARRRARQERPGAAQRRAAGGLHGTHAAGARRRQRARPLPGPRHVRPPGPRPRLEGAHPRHPRAAAAGRPAARSRRAAG